MSRYLKLQCLSRHSLHTALDLCTVATMHRPRQITQDTPHHRLLHSKTHATVMLPHKVHPSTLPQVRTQPSSWFHQLASNGHHSRPLILPRLLIHMAHLRAECQSVDDRKVTHPRN
jgi:hypothetical protein